MEAAASSTQRWSRGGRPARRQRQGPGRIGVDPLKAAKLAPYSSNGDGVSGIRSSRCRSSFGPTSGACLNEPTSRQLPSGSVKWPALWAPAPAGRRSASAALTVAARRIVFLDTECSLPSGYAPERPGCRYRPGVTRIARSSARSPVTRPFEPVSIARRVVQTEGRVSAAEVRVLGPVEVVDDDGPVSLSAKQRRLLAALVVADGRACGVDELVWATWGESSPASAAKLVQVYVSQLRKVLPNALRIVTRAGAYALELEHDVLDAHRFERLVAESRSVRATGNPALAASLIDQALHLWRGRAYGDLAYEELARAEADRLEELRLVALGERIDGQLALGSHAGVLGEILGLAAEHPLRERMQEQAMLALYRCGRQAEALDHYGAVRRTLQDELGLEP